MRYWKDNLEFRVENATAISLGKFDGLHRGHEFLIENLQRMKEQFGYESVAFTFDIPPKSRVEGETIRQLSTREEKVQLFEKAGIDYLVECPFTEEVRCMEPERFIRWMVTSLSVKAFVVGADFRFGYRRQGNYEVLKQFESVYGYETIVLPKRKDRGRDISSTYIREELLAGRIEHANELLGYPFFVSGEVIHGKKIGRSIGIPTVNLPVPEEKLLPPNGVYITSLSVDGKNYHSISNVGKKPTVSREGQIGIETNIFDCEEELYGHAIKVSFLKFLRPEIKFENLDFLKKQIENDIRCAKEYFAGK